MTGYKINKNMHVVSLKDHAIITGGIYEVQRGRGACFSIEPFDHENTEELCAGDRFVVLNVFEAVKGYAKKLREVECVCNGTKIYVDYRDVLFNCKLIIE